MLKSDATRRQGQVEHLAHVHALLEAVASAISAIEKNDLRRFETNLAVQETICNRLSANQWSLLPKATTGESPDAQLADAQLVDAKLVDARLTQEIRQAHVDLAQLNRVYAALLKRARRSVELMGALYRTYGEAQRHTWSCEV